MPSASASPRELIVVAKPGAELRVSSDPVRSLAAFDVSGMRELLSAPGRSLRPLFGLSEERMMLETRAAAAGVAAPLPDLSVFYRLYAPDAELDALAARLRQEPVVETAYVKPGAEPPIWFRDLEANRAEPVALSGDHSASQGYLNPAAQGGIDARFAWTQNGGRGRDVKIIDVEGAWRFTHEDLRENDGGLVGGVVVNNLLLRSHGTAVLGIVSGDENQLGVRGICPDARVSAVSVFGPEEGWGTAAAIRQAASLLHRGDILLVEWHRQGPEGGLIPLEWWPDDLMAIQYATGLDVIVVEAGGNGGRDLDADIYEVNPPPPLGPFPADWRNPFRRKHFDTGAILVGAGAPLGSGFGLPDLCRLPFSNFGSAFDAQGWGELVTTCGFGDLRGAGGPDEDFWYTDSFSGTSSAAPMVAGALACLQGIRKAEGLAPLGPADARKLLRDTGTPQGDHPDSPASRRIGNRPNLRQMVATSLQ